MIPVNYSIRIMVYNALGASPRSNASAVSCLYCNTIMPDFSNSTMMNGEQNETASSVTNGPPYIIIFSVVGAVLVLIIAVLLVLFITRYFKNIYRQVVQQK
jgi:hypothetical protein